MPSKNIKKLDEQALLKKSSMSLHRTLAPGITLSAVQRKSLNAIHYALQAYVKRNFESPEIFHSKHGERIVDFKMKRTQFESLIAYMSRNRVYLRDVLQQLTKIQVDWSNNLKGKKEEYRFTNIFMEAGLKDGYVHIKIPATTREALINPSVEATIDIIKLSQSLERKYAISMYEFVRSYFEKETSDNFTFEVEDEALRNSLGVPFKWTKSGQKKYSYPALGKLNERVIKPSIEELNGADFEFKVACSHNRLSCGSVYWAFEVTRTNVVQHRLIANEFASEIADIMQALRRYKVNKPLDLLAKITSEKDILYFQYCIEMVDKSVQSRSANNKISNMGGYFVRSLEKNKEAFENYYAEIQKKHDLEVSKKRKKELQAIDEQIEIARKEQKIKLREAHWATLPEEEKENLRVEFLDVVENSPTFGPSYREEVAKHGYDISPRMRGLWVGYLNEYFGITDEVIEETIRNMTITSTF